MYVVCDVAPTGAVRTCILAAVEGFYDAVNMCIVDNGLLFEFRKLFLRRRLTLANPSHERKNIPFFPFSRHSRHHPNPHQQGISSCTEKPALQLYPSCDRAFSAR